MYFEPCCEARVGMPLRMRFAVFSQSAFLPRMRTFTPWSMNSMVTFCPMAAMASAPVIFSGGWRDLRFRLLSRRFRLDRLARLPELAAEDKSVFPFFGGYAAMASCEMCHLCQQAVRRDAQRYEFEAPVRFAIEDNRAGILRLSGVGPPDDDPRGSLDGNGSTLRNQRTEGLRELAIETPDPGILFLNPQHDVCQPDALVQLCS